MFLILYIRWNLYKTDTLWTKSFVLNRKIVRYEEILKISELTDLIITRFYQVNDTFSSIEYLLQSDFIFWSYSLVLKNFEVFVHECQRSLKR
jgi:hypothetical protein